MPNQLVGQPLVEACAEVILPGIDDQRCKAMLVASRARRQVATKATAEEDEAIGVRIGPARDPVNDRRQHDLPVGAHDDALLVEHCPLSRSVETEHIVAPLHSRDDGRITFLSGSIVAARHYHGGTRAAGAVWAREVSGQCGFGKGDLHDLDRKLQQRQGSAEARPMAGVGGEQLRIVEIGTLVKESIAIIFACTQIALAGADPMATAGGPIGCGAQPFGGACECRIPGARVTGGDVGSDG